MLADFLRLLLRRWRLSALVLVLGLAAGAAGMVLVAPVQTSEARVLFVPPNQDATIEGTINPYLALGGSLGVVPSVVQATVSDAATAQKLLDAGHHGVYTVVVDDSQNAAPMLIVTVESPSAADSIGTMNAVVEQISQQLSQLQQLRAVDPRYIITATELTSTPKPLVVRSGQIQAGALAAVAVLVLGVAVIGLLSRGPRREPGRRHARPADHEPARQSRTASRSRSVAPSMTSGTTSATTSAVTSVAPAHVAVAQPTHAAPLVDVPATAAAPVLPDSPVVPEAAVVDASSATAPVVVDPAATLESALVDPPATAAPADRPVAPVAPVAPVEDRPRPDRVVVAPPRVSRNQVAPIPRTSPRRRGQPLTRPPVPTRSHEPVGPGRGSSVDGRP